ncbi:MAG: Pr6Pr family membrane protein [Lacisediminihabitans sp.]
MTFVDFQWRRIRSQFAAEVDCTVSVQPATVRTAVGLVRLLGAAVCVTALISRFVWGLGTVTFTPANFFAYLTIQSNLAFVTVTATAAIMALRMPQDPGWLTTARAVALSCTVSAGAVYALLVQQAGMRGVPITVPWSDQVLHFWLPTLAILEWVLAPGRGRARWRTVFLVLGYTVLWGVLTLVRGPIVGWYPYFFLDPKQVGSVGEFFLFSGVALVSFGSISSGIVALGRIRPLFSRLLASMKGGVGQNSAGHENSDQKHTGEKGAIQPVAGEGPARLSVGERP